MSNTLENICEDTVCALTGQYEKVRSFHLSKQTAVHGTLLWLRAVEVQCVPAEPVDLCQFSLRDGSVYTI